jgi:hypothetical protein
MVGDDFRKVVWILGAGFSVPLGGPLFRGLISREMHRTLSNWGIYARRTHEVSAPTEGGPQRIDVNAVDFGSIIWELYAAGLGTEPNPKLWSDAEQFLDRLEIASREPDGPLGIDVKAALAQVGTNWKPDEPRSGARQSILLNSHGLEEAHREAIRFVAGACSLFLVRALQNERVVDESEQWDPYRRWVEQLKAGQDAIITFNYDPSLDILAKHCVRRSVLGPLTSPMEKEPGTFNGHVRTCVPMYHLHGHVNWLRSSDGKTVKVSSEPVAYKTPEQAVIGIPGQAKRTLPEGLLKELWDRAMKAIEEATSVVFVGYRFPETDNMAKRCLLDALKKNPKVLAHVVLGTNNPDRPRLVGMIDWTRNRYENPVRVHELWAEDFFAVFERDGL